LNHRPHPYQECGLRNIFAAIIGSVLPAHRVAGQVERDMAVSGVTAINPEVRPRPVVFNRTHVELPPNNPPGGYDRAETAGKKSGVAHSITERLNRAPAWQQVSVLACGRSSAWHIAWSTVLHPQLCSVNGSWVIHMSAILIGIENSTAASFPQATDTYWTTENRILWNEKHRKAEECELVYEVSWVSELNVWRSFLRSQRWLEATR